MNFYSMSYNTEMEIQVRIKESDQHQRRKEADSMPSPLREGQTDTPINHNNEGEVCYDASVG
ncbi:MAG: hypothetical protein Q8L41_10295 [Anaerolineales bacterium]|nr:hypothetical protein [Anaerolineales bacterium]MDP2778131.1 hypothetical protein [Anaerolineales bacterium]